MTHLELIATFSKVAVDDAKVFPEHTKRPMRLPSPSVVEWDMRGSPQSLPSAEVNTWISLPFLLSLR